MYFAIISITFAVLAALAVLIGVLANRRRLWQVAVIRICATAASALLSLGIAWPVSRFAFPPLFNVLIGKVKLGIVSELINSLDSSMGSLGIFAAMLAGPFLFVILFALFNFVLGFFVNPIAKYFVMKNEINKALSGETQPPEEEEEKEFEEELKISAEDTEASVMAMAAEQHAAAVAEAEAKAKAAHDKRIEKLKKKAAKRRARKYEMLKVGKPRWISALVGGACGLIVFCLAIAPVVCTLEVVGEATAVAVGAPDEKNENEVMNTVAEVADAASLNVATVTVKLFGGGLVYDALTTYPFEGETVTFKNEVDSVGVLAKAFVEYKYRQADDKELVACLQSAENALEKSTLISNIGADIAVNASQKWVKNEKFCGISMPAIGGEKAKPIMNGLLEAVGETTPETFKEDAATLIDALCVMVSNDGFEKLKNGISELIKDEKMMSELLGVLLVNDRFEVAGDIFTDYGVDLYLGKLANNGDKTDSREEAYEGFVDELSSVSGYDTEKYEEIFDKYAIRFSDNAAEAQALSAAVNSGTTVSNWLTSKGIASEKDFLEKTELVFMTDITDGRNEVEDGEAEAKTLAFAYLTMYNAMNQKNIPINELLTKAGPGFDGFVSTDTVGQEKTELMLIKLMQSNYMRNKTGMSVLAATESAQRIAENSRKSDFTTLMNSLASAVDVIEATKDLNGDTQKALDDMIKNLTPESADVLQAVMTPEFIEKYGVSEKSAKPVSSMLSNTFEGLSDAKENGMPQEQLDKETKAVSDMMDLLISQTKKDDETKDDKPKKTVTEYVDTVLNSDILSDALLKEAYENETDTVPKNDPLKIEKTLSPENKTEMVSALNSHWDNASESEEKELERMIHAIAAVTNVNIKHVNGQWSLI